MQHRQIGDDECRSDEECAELIAAALQRATRPLIVGLIYLVTLSVLGAPLPKAAVTAAIAVGLMLLPLGSRFLQGVVLVLLACTLSIWIDIPPREYMAALANAVLHR